MLSLGINETLEVELVQYKDCKSRDSVVSAAFQESDLLGSSVNWPISSARISTSGEFTRV
jgi:hypothetical protein